jgi:hypothetical protein
MDTTEIAERFGVTRSAVLKWCLKNKVKRKLGKNGVMEYDFTEKDIKKFESRKSPGWKKGRPRKAV